MKPSDFNIGVSEVFSVLLPGFAVVLAILIYIGEINLTADIKTLEWVIIVVLSYVAGHLLFAISSWWDEFNNLFPYKGNDEIISAVSGIRSTFSEVDCDAINNYQWSKSILSKVHPIGYLEVLRKEADSKLFRSLLIPQFFVLWLAWNEVSLVVLISLMVIIVMTYMRYRGQRNKGCNIAYTHILTYSILSEGIIKGVGDK